MEMVCDLRYPNNAIDELRMCQELWFKPEQVTFSQTANVFSFRNGRYILPLPSVKFKIALAHSKDGTPATVRRIRDQKVRRFYTALLIQYGVSNGFSYTLCAYLVGVSSTWAFSALKNYPELKPMASKRNTTWRDPVGVNDDIVARSERSRMDARMMPDVDIPVPPPISWDLDLIVQYLNKESCISSGSPKYEAPVHMPKQTVSTQEKSVKRGNISAQDAVLWWITQASNLLEKGSHFQASLLTMSLCAICDQSNLYSDHSRAAYCHAVNNNWSGLRGEFKRWINDL